MAAPLIDESLRRELTALYRHESRHYHGLAHIQAMLELARIHDADLSDPAAVEAAIWFHDAIYDSHASDNEARSASLAQNRLAERADAKRIDRIAAMILASATHELPLFGDQAAIDDAALFLDMDLAILGATPDIFDEYEQQVRLEYSWVPETAWIAGRSNVLKKFLDRPNVYHSKAFSDQFEQPARKNLARALERLRNRQA